jgi:Cu/Ag efflux protein CusF
MTMEFSVSDKKVISNFKRGDKIRFQVNKELELIKIELN